MSILQTLRSLARGFSWLHHLGGYLSYYFHTSWKQLLCVNVCVNVLSKQGPLAHTEKEKSEEWASVWRLKIE